MTRFSRNLPLLLALAAGVHLVGPPGTARADLTVTIAETGGPSQTYTDATSPGSVSYSSMTFGDFYFTFVGVTSTSPGTGPGGAKVTDLEFTADNTAATAKTLTISVTATGFTNPGGSGDQVLLVSSLASSNLTGASSSASFKSGLNGTETPSVTITGATGASPAVSYTQTSWSGSSYTLTNSLSITLGSGGSSSLDATTQVVAPAPAGLVLAATGFPLLGLGFWRHRRLRKA